MPSSDDEEIPPQQATILIEHPLGYPSLVSRSLQRELISRGHHVCIYDRPGYMLSPQGYVPMPPRTLQQAFTGALYDSGESGPFYIVGQHSGSEYAHLFAHENSGSVVGLSFIHPTDASLDALMWKEMPAETRHNITSLINKGDVASDNEHPLADLNTQRVSAALGIGLPNAPTLPNVYDDQALAEWTYSNPNMGQAQFFEKTQLSLLTRLIGEMEEVKDPAKKLPVLLFGLDSNKLGQDSFLAAAGASTQFDVEISDSKDDRPLVLSRVADQISWHIARLH
ncbi:hypothetical protein GQ54DRAFT_314433 [Martensiomyces pterosporus]|nr:hypothetical protein GQ54DRAFT_314433 [Martensiomyces pterosporus]